MANHPKPQQGKRSFTGQIMADAAHKATVAAMRGNCGAPAARAWTQKNGKAVQSRKACRGKVAY